MGASAASVILADFMHVTYCSDFMHVYWSGKPAIQAKVLTAVVTHALGSVSAFKSTQRNSPDMFCAMCQAVEQIEIHAPLQEADSSFMDAPAAPAAQASLPYHPSRDRGFLPDLHSRAEARAPPVAQDSGGGGTGGGGGLPHVTRRTGFMSDLPAPAARQRAAATATQTPRQSQRHRSNRAFARELLDTDSPALVGASCRLKCKAVLKRRVAVYRPCSVWHPVLSSIRPFLRVSCTWSRARRSRKLRC